MTKIKGGFYIKARCIQESKIATSPPHVREIWDWLLKEANHKDNKYSGFFIKRGQLFRTYKEIREGLHWMVGYRKMMYSENHTKKAMKTLREYGMIATTKALGGVLITIINYDRYQTIQNYESTNESTNERTNAEPMRNHPLPDNNKNEKNENNKQRAKPDVKEAEVFTEEQLKEKQLNEQIQEVIDLFYNSVNPNINYGNKTTRSACKFLIDKYGVDQVKRATEYAVSVQGKPYAPTITTPFQLKEKMSQLAIYKQKQEQPTENHKGKEIFT